MYLKIMKKYIAGYFEEVQDYPELEKRMKSICTSGRTLDYYIGDINHLFSITSFIGMHTQEFIKGQKIQLELLSSIALSCDMYAETVNKTSKAINMITIADQLIKGLFIITTWILANKTNITPKCYMTPAVGILSLPNRLSACDGDQRQALKKSMGAPLADKVFQKNSLYTVVPMFSFSGNPIKDAENLDWVDSGADEILRLLILIHQGNATISDSGSHKIVHVDGIQLGSKHFPLPTEEQRIAADRDIAQDILPNLVDFSDRVINGDIP